MFFSNHHLQDYTLVFARNSSIALFESCELKRPIRLDVCTGVQRMFQRLKLHYSNHNRIAIFKLHLT